MRANSLGKTGWGAAVFSSTVRSSGVSTDKIRRTVLVPPLPMPVSLFRMRQKLNTTRSEEHTSELQSLMRNSYAVFCLKTKKNNNITHKPQIVRLTRLNY